MALGFEVAAGDVVGASAVELAGATQALADFAGSVDLDAEYMDLDVLDSSVDIADSHTSPAAFGARVVRTLCERVAHDFVETRRRQENSIEGYGRLEGRVAADVPLPSVLDFLRDGQYIVRSVHSKFLKCLRNPRIMCVPGCEYGPETGGLE